ncbi:hypothetical protein KP509_01G030300 [Ceratopteris richardii]|uniref:Major facilitator superfamily (MFS) profile domain-containing protein n=1 Tax=Ceratopteris richardii TaxID=49495 RepID=A0A8T2VBW2_CERRI|nr:hypothetical protein KP509_01G030300 [Ceratopteris richardii]
MLFQVVIGSLLGVRLKDTGELALTDSIIVVLMICWFVIAFAYSWGCMAMLIPTEIFQLDTRSAGQGVAVFMNLLFTIFMAQAFFVSALRTEICNISLLCPHDFVYVLIYLLLRS